MSSSGKRFAALAALSLLIATLLGAYTSHGLTGFDARAVTSIDTAVRYQFYHGLALLAVAVLGEQVPGIALRAAGWAFAAGIVLFCGGIYASSLAGWDAASPVAPFGGFAFIVGWLAMLVAMLRPPLR